MKNQELRHEIVRRHHEGQSMRGIAGDLGISRERVRRVLAGHERARSGEQPASSLPAPRTERKSKLDDYEDLMRQLLARYPHMTAIRMLEELRAAGYRGGYTILKTRVRELRPAPSRPLVQRFETGPGRQAQMDYAQYEIDFTQEGRRRIYLFSYVLAYSRRQYLCFTESQDFATGHRRSAVVPPAREGLRAPRGRCRYLPVRQYEGRGGPLRVGPAGIQHALSGVRHALRLPPTGLPAPSARNKGESGAAVSLCRNQPAQWP